jgi:hypothetical protein
MQLERVLKGSIVLLLQFVQKNAHILKSFAVMRRRIMTGAIMKMFV